jgi:hypothetical protein
MATSLDQLNVMRDGIIACIGNPALEVVRPDGGRVQYRTVSEALLALSAVDELIRIAGGSSQNRVSLAQHRRGDGLSGYGGDRGDWNG